MQATAAQEPGDVASLALHTALQALLSETRQSRHSDSTVGPLSSDDSSSSPGISVTDDCSSKLHQDQQIQTKRPKRQRKDRVPTYYLRKSEKLSLELEIQLLNAQLASLQSEQQIRKTRQDDESALKAVTRARKENDKLRDAMQYQQLPFARVQSAFGATVTAQKNLPFETCIQLGSDWDERHATLLAMKNNKLQSAQQYIAERSRFVDRTAPLAEGSRFKAPNGDLCALLFDVTPFEGIRSVQQVFDALLFYGLNMEISISEVLGDITIREDDGVREQGILHNCLLSSVRDVNVQVESNTVMFYKFYEGSEDFGGGREFGVIVADFVNEDELYPYSPATCLRHDVTAALTVTLEPHKIVNEFGEEQEEHIAVMTRSAFLKLHPTDLPIPPHVMQELRARVEGWGDAMIKTITGILYPELPLLSSTYAPPPLPASHRLLET